MKLAHSKLTLLTLSLLLLIPLSTYSQKRQLKPKRNSKIESVDNFVNVSYELYNKVFVYDSLSQAGVEVPSELEDELVKHVEKDIDSLWTLMPDIFDDIANSNASFIKKSKATLNLNKSKKALKYCVKYVKGMLLGNKEDEED